MERHRHTRSLPEAQLHRLRQQLPALALAARRVQAHAPLQHHLACPVLSQTEHSTLLLAVVSGQTIRL